MDGLVPGSAAEGSLSFPLSGRDRTQTLRPERYLREHFLPPFVRAVEQDVRAIMVEERWTSDAHMRQHLQSDAYRRILLVIEMAQEPPEIRFDRIMHTSGVETIEKARSQIL